MSEIPPDNETILAEMLWWKWHDDYDRDDWKPSLKRVLDDHEVLDQKFEHLRKEYWNQAEKQGSPPSWRDYRNFTVHRVIERDFDIDELIRDCIDAYHDVRGERYD